MEGSLTVGGDRFAQQEVTVEGGQKTWVRGSLLPWPREQQERPPQGRTGQGPVSL